MIRLSSLNILWDRFTRHIDGLLMGFVLILLAIGCVTLFSAVTPNHAYFFQQLRSIALGLVVMWVVANTHPIRIAQAAIPLYIVSVVLLVGVSLFGVTVNGSQRWLSILGMRFQPSELAKIAVPLFLAWYFHKIDGRLNILSSFVAAAIILLPAALIKKQPDLGTALLVIASGFYILYLVRLPWKIIFSTVLLGVLYVAFFAHGYQLKRISAFIDPAADPAASGYHTIQASIAIGSGGLTGKGWLNGKQTHLNFLPEHHTDFIFAVYSEEFGLFGIVLLLVLFGLLLWRSVVIAGSADTVFERLLAGGITLMLFTYTFVNMGMVSGILPIVGVPLPFFSFGGTAMITMSVCIGILMSIKSHGGRGRSPFD
ncbi:MAG: rod shape-determining protein RodA [Burkholderiales bacterium]|jgi:rod shape determining protein RodA|nr:rod shape-determining protein RodA [Burkholderiales bacterium]